MGEKAEIAPNSLLPCTDKTGAEAKQHSVREVTDRSGLLEPLSDSTFLTFPPNR